MNREQAYVRIKYLFIFYICFGIFLILCSVLKLMPWWGSAGYLMMGSPAYVNLKRAKKLALQECAENI